MKSALRPYFISLPILVVFGGCFGKLPNATRAVSGGDPAVLTECETAAVYVSEVEPVIQQTCVSCHRAGAEGGAVLSFKPGSSLTQVDLFANYSAAKAYDAASGGVESGAQARLATAALGTAHSGGAILSTIDPRYASLENWLQEELDFPCE